MMQDNQSLERLVAEERYSDILRTLTAKQLAVVALKLDGLDGQSIAELLGITRQHVFQRLLRARLRVLRKYPEYEWRETSRTQ